MKNRIDINNAVEIVNYLQLESKNAQKTSIRKRTIIKELENIKKDLEVVSIREIPAQDKTFLNITQHQVILKSGDIFNREKLMKGKKDGSAAIVVPITKDNKSLVIVQPRVFKSDPVSIEVPAGYLDAGETHLDAALRELKEETGYEAEELIELKAYYQDQGISSAYNKCYVALGCEKKYEQKLDRDEYIKYLECTFNDLVYLVNVGYIDDANSIIAINEAKKYLRKR